MSPWNTRQDFTNTATDGAIFAQRLRDFEIVIADKPARAAEFGASELQTYVEKITGCRLDILTAPSDTMPVKIFVGESKAARQAGVTADGLGRDAFRMISTPDWLALVGNDVEFVPREPWARRHGQWLGETKKTWEELAGHPWRNPIASRIYKNYNKYLAIWDPIKEKEIDDVM